MSEAVERRGDSSHATQDEMYLRIHSGYIFKNVNVKLKNQVAFEVNLHSLS